MSVSFIYQVNISQLLSSSIFLLSSLLVNQLTGSIPSCFNFTKVIFFFVYNNSLTGHIPTFIKYANNLEELLLQNNGIQDNLNNVFDGTTIYRRLYTIDVSGNGITGDIPSIIFSYPNLKNLNLGKNCIDRFPVMDYMYNATSLEMLILDGLGISPHFCKLLDYREMRTGTIPECIFQMPSLQTLHLSGLGMMTSFPSLQNITRTLKTLSLTYNMLTGTIPTVVQTKNWDDLDLRYNKLAGTLAPGISVEDGSYLGLDNNRLSGEIWPSLINAQDISILQSNMFSCPNGKPKNDEDEHEYTCGSTILNFSLILSFSSTAFGGLVLLVMYVVRSRYKSIQTFMKNVVKWYVISKSGLADHLSGNNSVHFLSAILDNFRYFAFVVVLYTLLMLLPAYLIMSVHFKTYYYQYGWVVSGFYFKGTTATVVQFLLLLFLTVIVNVADDYFLAYIHRKWQTEVRDAIRHPTFDDTNRLTDTFINNSSKMYWFKKERASYVLAFIINFAIMGGANFGFIYLEKYSDDANVILTEFLFISFKLSFKKWIMPATLTYCKWLATKIQIAGAPLSDEDLAWYKTFSQNDILVCSLFQIVNEILIPLLVVLLFSTQCLYGYFFDRLILTVEYPIKYCATRCSGSLVCCKFDKMPEYFTFKPDYLYYSDCSIFLLTKYIPVTFIMFTLTAFILPSLVILQDYFIDEYYHYTDSGTLFGNLCGKFARFQIDAQLNLMSITPMEILKLSNGRPQMVLDINQSLLTWTTNLGTTTTTTTTNHNNNTTTTTTNTTTTLSSTTIIFKY